MRTKISSIEVDFSLYRKYIGMEESAKHIVKILMCQRLHHQLAFR